jgi:hypothetical protein
MDQISARQVLALVVEHLHDWPMRSAEAFRNAILGEGLLTVNPMISGVQETDMELMGRMIQDAVVEGRMIDFGYIPNQVIKTESVRCRHMFETNELQHPFESWLGITSWEGGYNGYYVTPHPNWVGATLVLEMYGVTTPTGHHAVVIFDMIAIQVRGLGDTVISPAIMNYPSGHSPGEHELHHRGANSLDPLVTMLRLLADASIPVTYHEAPERLNKARLKQGKWAIPGHTTVQTHDYVTAFSQRSVVRGAGRGGTHASPIAHWRREHIRHLADGRVIPVKSSKVNWRDHEELHRMFYRIREKK